MDYNNIRRRGIYIDMGGGVTATEGMEGNLPALTIRKNGKIVHVYRGSSLCFSSPHLTADDTRYLSSLAGLE